MEYCNKHKKWPQNIGNTMSHTEQENLPDLQQAEAAANPDQEVNAAEATAQEFFKKVEEKNGKILPFDPLPRNEAAQLEQALLELEVLRNQLLEKITASQAHNDTIKGRVEALVEAKKIQINNDHYTHFDQSITTYISLLGNISQELEAELKLFVPYTLPTPPPVIMVHKDDTDDVRQYIQQKIRWIKRHVKTINKDLTVSYSRYSFGFDSQMKQLDMIESHFQK